MTPDAPRPQRLKRSVALVIRSPDRPSDVLAVLRPPDDEDLPDVWGLPAASLREGESWPDAVRRAARDKLSLDVEPGHLLNEGSQERETYTLEMRVYQASVVGGEPAVDRTVRGVTRYVNWKWAPADALELAAKKGSLCARLFLEVEKG